MGIDRNMMRLAFEASNGDKIMAAQLLADWSRYNEANKEKESR